MQDVTSVKENAEVGTNYETTALEFAGYKLVGVAKDSDSTFGQVTEGAKHVVYVYEKVTPVLTDKHEDKETPSTSTQTEQKPVKEAPATPVAAKLVTKKQVASKQADTNKQALPQTGETQSETNATVLGALALGLAGIFGLGAKKKEDKD